MNVNENNDPFAEEYKHKFLVLYITERCNLACPKCYVKNKKNGANIKIPSLKKK